MGQGNMVSVIWRIFLGKWNTWIYLINFRKPYSNASYSYSTLLMKLYNRKKGLFFLIISFIWQNFVIVHNRFVYLLLILSVFIWCRNINNLIFTTYREPKTVFVPQMFVPENGQSWQCVGCLLFQASRALALTRTWFSLQYWKEMR